MDLTMHTKKMTLRLNKRLTYEGYVMPGMKLPLLNKG